MRLLMTLRIAFKALFRNKLRSSLTMLGMIIGVAAVIAMVALANGAQSTIESQIKSAGTNLIIVMAGNFQAGGVRQGSGAANTLTLEDAQAIRDEVTGVQYLAVGVRTRSQIIASNQNWNTNIQGTDVDLPADPVVAGAVRGVLHGSGRQHARRRWRCWARWSATTCSARTWIPPARPSASATSPSR